MTTSAEITTLIRSAKLAFPGMRVGQLIWDATMGEDIFYMSDEDLARHIRTYMSERLTRRISYDGHLAEGAS